MALFRTDIYDRARNWQAPLGDVKKLEGTIRANAISDMTLTVAAGHKRAGLLAEPGARIRTKFRGEYLISGPLRQRAGAGPGVTGDLVFSCQSDWRILHNFLGYVNPAERVTSGPLLRQGEESAYYTIGRRPAETVLKDVVRKNIVERRGYGLTVAADKGRGKVTEASFRMHPLYDRLFPAIQDAGLVVTVEQNDAGALVLDCYEPAPYPNVLTEGSRVIQKWSFTGSAPEATSGVLGAQGQGEQREFLAFRDPAREALWGDVSEVFKDARDTSDGTTHAQRMASALLETAAKSSLTVELAESGNFKILGPKGLRPGQMVTARVGNGIEVTDLVSEINFSWDAANGLKLDATIGPKDDPLDTLVQAITSLSRGFNDLKVGT